MSTKTFCDKCQAEVKNFSYVVKAWPSDKPEVSNMFKDVCETCTKKFFEPFYNFEQVEQR